VSTTDSALSPDMESGCLRIAPTRDVAAVFFHADHGPGGSRPRKTDWLVGFDEGEKTETEQGEETGKGVIMGKEERERTVVFSSPRELLWGSRK